MYVRARNDGLEKNKELGSNRMKSNKTHLSVEIQPHFLIVLGNVVCSISICSIMSSNRTR